MTDNEKNSATEMTDNEIIQTLERCSDGTGKGIIKATLDLIKRKDEQIEALIAGQETLQKFIAEKDAEIERLRSQNLKRSVEIDTLRNSTKTSTIIIENLENKSKTMTTEVERLSNINQSLTNHLTNTRTETVKEFAERLKDYYIKDKRYDKPNAHTLIAFLFNVIDNLVKEMVGDAE